MQRLCLHTLETLPDSSMKRRDILECVRCVLPKGDDLRNRAHLMLRIMDQFEDQQKQLRLDFDLEGGGK